MGLGYHSPRGRHFLKSPEKKNTQWLYGVNPVLEALRGGRQVKALHLYKGRRRGVEELRAEAEGRGIAVSLHDSEFFDSRFSKGHQGVAAEVVLKEYVSLEELLRIPEARGEAAFFVLLDELEDPRNLGAVLRTADAAGVHGVVVQKHRAAGLGPQAVKASAGASEYVAVAKVANVKNAMRAMREAGISLVGAEAGAGQAPWEEDLSGPLALVIGSEGRGLRKTVKEQCDILVSLPLFGRINSLNTSVAAGVLLYEVRRQRG